MALSEEAEDLHQRNESTKNGEENGWDDGWMDGDGVPGTSRGAAFLSPNAHGEGTSHGAAFPSRIAHGERRRRMAVVVAASSSETYVYATLYYDENIPFESRSFHFLCVNSALANGQSSSSNIGSFFLLGSTRNPEPIFIFRRMEPTCTIRSKA
jgi:hypothetical protein